MRGENVDVQQYEHLLRGVLCLWQLRKVVSSPTFSTLLKWRSAAQQKKKKKAVLGNKMTVGNSGVFVCCAIPTPNPSQGSRQILTA